MGTELRLWLEEHAWRLALDGETICWVRDMRAHLDRCRETGEDPFPDAMTIDELIAEAKARGYVPADWQPTQEVRDP